MIDRLGRPCALLRSALRHVALDTGRIGELARELCDHPPALPPWEHLHLPEEPGPDLDAIVWLGNAINFCYWVPEGEEMWSVEAGGRREVDAMALFGALRNALDAGIELGDGRYLVEEGPEGPRRIFEQGSGALQLRERRIAILQAIGRNLNREFGGRLENAVAAAPADASGHARFLARTFPSYEDSRVHSGVRLTFLKRAQLAAGMLHGRRVALGAAGLEAPERLTVYADYMLPRALRAEGVIAYSDELARRVHSLIPLPAGGPEETEIRIATVAACHLLVERARELGAELDGMRLDFLLWRRGFGVDAPHHRTVTTDY